MDRSELLLLDGATGTMLQAAGLPAGQPPELWNLTRPDAVRRVCRLYVEAGSDVVCTNTFGANRKKLAGSGYTPAEVVAAGVALARQAAGGAGTRVALDIGPIGQLLEPLGTLSFDEAYDIFAELVTAGAAAGADLVFFETMSDLYELRAGVLAAKENTDLPVWASMTFEKSGRTFLGTAVSSMALTLDGLGVDAMGFNCSLGPEELLPLAAELIERTDKPVLLKPNAGLPDPATGAYAVTPEDFARQLAKAAGLGVSIFGGCCGTTPDFIRALKGALSGAGEARRPARAPRGVCSAARTVELSGVRVVGERINPTGKPRLQRALREGDVGYVMERAVEQQDAGADILDINVGAPGVNEPDIMQKVVKAVQSVTDLPLQIDSSDPAAIEAGLRAVNGRAIVNSVNGKPGVLEAVLPLCKKYGAAVVGLCLDGHGIPEDWRGRAEIARRILDAALSYGIPREDVLIDCLTLTVSAQQAQAAETLRAVRYVKEELGLRTVLGVSNISFGLPAREHVTASFLTQALYAGLDLPIINPGQTAVMGAVAAFRALSGQDRDCAAYIERFAQAPDAPAAAPDGPAPSIADAVLRGLGREVAALTERALETLPPLEVVETLLIPALDLVGERYDRQELFLPQLIRAADAAGEGFSLVRDRIAAHGEHIASRGTVVLATVRGDIHDIGKNIVRVVLENYGYTVIDLGRDVPEETVVETVLRERAPLVGLSALMTTTLPGMAGTIRALRESGAACRIMVGGAVLTPDYAAELGADYYAKDAKQAADIAKSVLG